MTLLARNRRHLETVSSPGSERAYTGKPFVTAEISHTSTDWIKNSNLRKALAIVILIVLIGLGGYAYLEHSKLQGISSRQVVELTQQVKQDSVLNNELDSINRALATTNAKLKTDESTLAGVNQRLSSYGFSGPVSEFASYDALITWLKTDNTHAQLYSPTFQCVDFASMMSEHAIQAGYWIFPAVDMANGHMKCIAPIGSDLYAIEPQTNDVILWAKKSY
jgi:hypothetical protein